MFGKPKPAPAPSAPFVMQVLTTEYLIEGTAAGDTELFFPIAYRELWNPLILTAARIKVAGRANIPERPVSTFEVSGNGVVAIIPRKDVSQMARYDD